MSELDCLPVSPMVRVYSAHRCVGCSRNRSCRSNCSYSSSCSSRKMGMSELRRLLVSAMEHIPSEHRCVGIRS